MQSWEYEVIELKGNKDKDMIPLLDLKGTQGWELVSVILVPGTKVVYLAFLKRPLEE